MHSRDGRNIAEIYKGAQEGVIPNRVFKSTEIFCKKFLRRGDLEKARGYFAKTSIPRRSEKIL